MARKFILSAVFVVAVVVLGLPGIVRPIAMPDLDADITDSLLELGELPPRRSFYMGFTFQPYAWSQPAFERTARLIDQNGDFITIFSDTGIPWPEALRGESYHPNVEAKLKMNLAAIKPNQVVALVANAMGIDRRSLAGYAGVTEPMDRPGEWAQRDFDSPEVIEAYVNYANDMIARFEPQYFFYLAEANAAITDVHSEEFRRLKIFAQNTYAQLKSAHPDLKVGIEFVLSNEDYMAERVAVTSALLPYTDIYAVSTYPFEDDRVAGDARKLPRDWFEQAAPFITNKPFAILETAFAADNFMHPTMGIRVHGHEDRLLIPGSPKSQAIYIKRVLKDAHALNAEFVNLWAVKDMDALYERLQLGDSAFSDPLWRLIEHSGLFDENDSARPAHDIWRQWLAIPKR